MTDNCHCLEPTQGECEGEGVSLGTDDTHGRYGSVRLHTCPDCRRVWLSYSVEYEGFSRSGRWYRAVITPEVAQTVTAETAVKAIAASEYQVYGGSYFSSNGTAHVGPIEVSVDL